VALGYLEVIRSDEKNLTPMHKKILETIQGENQKLQRLVEKLIIFSTVQNPENIVIDRGEAGLGDVIDAALKSLWPRLTDGSVSVRWSRADLNALGKFEVDVTLLKEVFRNLVENAVKFNDKEKKELSIAARREVSAVRVSVTDNGPGIPPEEYPKLFQKFYQVEEHFTGQIEGMGLGLVFVKNVVEAHGGTVGFRSQPGKGSEFFFTLPFGK